MWCGSINVRILISIDQHWSALGSPAKYTSSWMCFSTSSWSCHWVAVRIVWEEIFINEHEMSADCCGQLWVWHIVCGQTCDGLYHFIFYLINFGIPYGSRTIKPALARHTGVQVPVVPAKVITWSFLTNYPKPMPINIGTYHIQPTGVHGLCFGSCFSGPLPLCSLILGPLSRVHFGASLVGRLYSEIDHTYHSIEAQCVSHHYPRWTATLFILMTWESTNVPGSFHCECHKLLRR